MEVQKVGGTIVARALEQSNILTQLKAAKEENRIIRACRAAGLGPKQIEKVLSSWRASS